MSTLEDWQRTALANLELCKQKDAEIATLRRELDGLKAPYGNPFNCGHALRFVWTDAAGQKACAACRMFVAERLEREQDEARAGEAALRAGGNRWPLA